VVRFTYKVGGYMEPPVDQIAPAVDGVIGEQLARLSALFGEVQADEPDGATEPVDSKEIGTAEDGNQD